MVYNINIYTKGGIYYLWGDRASILPRVGDTIKFDNKYKVVEVVLHLLDMREDSIDVTIYVEKEE